MICPRCHATDGSHYPGCGEPPEMEIRESVMDLLAELLREQRNHHSRGEPFGSDLGPWADRIIEVRNRDMRGRVARLEELVAELVEAREKSNADDTELLQARHRIANVEKFLVEEMGFILWIPEVDFRDSPEDGS